MKQCSHIVVCCINNLCILKKILKLFLQPELIKLIYSQRKLCTRCVNKLFYKAEKLSVSSFHCLGFVKALVCDSDLLQSILPLLKVLKPSGKTPCINSQLLNRVATLPDFSLTLKPLFLSDNFFYKSNNRFPIINDIF